MARISQLVRKPRKRKSTRAIVPALQACPQNGVLHTGLYDYPEETELGVA